MTRAHAFKELDGRIVKRLHEILKNADLKKLSIPDLAKQLSAEFEMDFAECEGFGDMIPPALTSRQHQRGSIYLLDLV
jgi:hypothetical protein